MKEKQYRFCCEYLVDLNATQAAIRAGYSEKTAYSAGQRLLKNVEAKNCISERLSEMNTAKVAEAREIMEALTAVARGEMVQDVYTLTGERFQRNPTIRERLIAFELLGKRYGLFTEKMQLSGEVRVEDARARLAQKLAKHFDAPEE